MVDRLINDPDPYVRIAVVEQGYRLDILINDSAAIVRNAVVHQNYGLDQLINDKNPSVAYTAKQKLAALNNTTVNDV